MSIRERIEAEEGRIEAEEDEALAANQPKLETDDAGDQYIRTTWRAWAEANLTKPGERQ